MSPRRRALLITAAALAFIAVLAVEAAPALAAAGGGAAGFSGGSGGGGFGGGGGGGAGKGFAIYLIFRVIIQIALLGHGKGLIVLVALALVWYLYTRFWPKMRAKAQSTAEHGRTRRRKTQKRERTVELAAAVASETNPVFDPDAVRSAAVTLFKDVQAAWDGDDRVRLRGLLTTRLAGEWERRLDEMERRGWRNHVEPLGEPEIEYVGLRNTRYGVPTVTVRVEARLRDYVVDRNGRTIKRAGQFSQTTRLREYWTLENRDGHWVLASIEQGAEGSHQLDDTVVQADWADTGALRDEAMLEGAAEQAAPAGTNVADLINVDISTDARAAAADLSVADGRFAADVLEIAARRAVSAWAQAVDGSTAALSAIADPAAVEQLLYAGDPDHRTRLVVRGITVQTIGVVALEPSAAPPTMTIDVVINGRRYLQDRDTTAVLSGSSTRATTFTERWTLGLSEDPQQPWRIVAAATPSAAER
jgi:predicted lipid-binding transport protein (Tim44 family)